MASTRYDLRGRAAWITLDSPETRNALSAAMISELGAHLRTAIDDAAVRVIVLTGNGPAFCAGAWTRTHATPGRGQPRLRFFRRAQPF